MPYQSLQKTKQISSPAQLSRLLEGKKQPRILFLGWRRSLLMARYFYFSPSPSPPFVIVMRTHMFFWKRVLDSQWAPSTLVLGKYLTNTTMTDRQQTRIRVFHITNFYWGHQSPIFKPLPIVLLRRKPHLWGMGLDGSPLCGWGGHRGGIYHNCHHYQVCSKEKMETI